MLLKVKNQKPKFYFWPKNKKAKFQNAKMFFGECQMIKHMAREVIEVRLKNNNKTRNGNKQR